MLSNNLQTASGLEQLDYQRYLNDLNQYNTDRKFGYGQTVDQYNAMTGQEAADWERQYALAQLAAQYGDYSGLQALGITPSIQTGGSGGGGGGGGGSTPPKEKTGTTEKKFNQIQNNTTPLSASTIQTLTTAYGGKALTKAQWEAILNKNPGITEQALRDAGFYIKDAASTPPGTGNTGGQQQAVKDYSSAVAAMKAAGVSSVTASSVMTESEWKKRKESYNNTGLGGAEVANYASYIDYLNDYVEYAIQNK